MKPFRFRLERLKQLRTRELDRERAELDRSRAICDSLDVELRHRTAEHRRREEALEDRLDQGLSGASLRSETANTEQGEQAVRDTEDQIAGAETQRAQSQGQLLDAWRRMRLLERLEARGRARHARDEDRRAQQQLDEAGQLRWWDRNR